MLVKAKICKNQKVTLTSTTTTTKTKPLSPLSIKEHFNRKLSNLKQNPLHPFTKLYSTSRRGRS
jgi:hypothetical protein